MNDNTEDNNKKNNKFNKKISEKKNLIIKKEEKEINNNIDTVEKTDLLTNFFTWLLSRKILVTVINLFIVTAGILCFFMLDWKQEPMSNKPVIRINTTSQFGTHIDMFENEITKKLEEGVGTISGIDYYSSETKNGTSDITVHFKDNMDNNEALNRIRAVVASQSKDFPSYANYPSIYSGDNKDSGILDILFYPLEELSNKDKLMAVKKYVDEDIKQRILNIEGVASVTIYGASNPDIYVSLDLAKIHRLKLNVIDVKRILSRALTFSHNNTVGNIILGTKKYSINSVGETKSIDDIKNIEIAPGLKVSDIGTVKVKVRTSDIYFNGGSSAIQVVVHKSSTGNPLNTIKKIKALIKDSLSERNDIKVSFVNRLSNTEELFKKVKQTGWEALILVLIIVLLFTFSLTASIVPACAVPVSIIATFMTMKIFNLSFNPATLAGLVLSIGLVVDDAIVILESIHKKIQTGLDPLKAAISSTAELCLPIILMTLTLAFVFLPTLFGEGPTRYEMKEFAIVISSSVIFSGLNSLTLSPVLSYILMGKHKENKWHKKVMERIDGFYDKLLSFIFKIRKIFLGLISLLIITVILISRTIQSENKPSVSDRNVSISGRVYRQEDALQKKFFSNAVDKISIILKKYKGKYYKFFYTSMDSGRLSITLNLNNNVLSRRKEIIDQLIKEISQEIPELNFSLNSDSLEKKISFAVTGEKKSQELYEMGQKLINTLKDEKLTEGMWFSFQKSDNYNFSLDFNQIQNYNLDSDRVKEMLNIFFHSMSLGNIAFVGHNKNFKGWINIDKKYKYSPHQILDMSFPFPDKKDERKTTYIRLGDLIKIGNTESLTRKTRCMGYPSVSFTCGITKDKTIGTVIDRIKMLQKTQLPFGTRIEFFNEARDYLNSKGNLKKMIIFAILCIFFILAAQFESLIDALLILSTAPLAFVGAVFALKTFNLTFNVYTIIGLITLTGLITKHGILLVSSINSMRGSGIKIITAVRLGAISRLNPVLMTTLAMILGSIPLAISKNVAINPLRQMSIIIIFGIMIGTMMVLFITPILYYYLKRKKWY